MTKVQNLAFGLLKLIHNEIINHFSITYSVPHTGSDFLIGRIELANIRA